jgi:hypothetical protein
MDESIELLRGPCMEVKAHLGFRQIYDPDRPLKTWRLERRGKLALVTQAQQALDARAGLRQGSSLVREHGRPTDA